MEYEDKQIKCKDCGETFVHTRGEQSFMQELLDNGKLDHTDEITGVVTKGILVIPVRCRPCKQLKKKRFDDK